MNRFLTFAFFVATVAMSVAASAQVITMDTIKDKVSIGLGQQQRLKFTADGEKLLQPKRHEGSGDGTATVEIKLHVTDSTPFRVQGVSTRPFLVVSNGFERTLHFRAVARLKGSKEFFEVGEAGGPIELGDQSLKCWESGSLVEEVVLYQFTLSARPAK